jgi:hypothetical protein
VRLRLSGLGPARHAGKRDHAEPDETADDRCANRPLEAAPVNPEGVIK